MSNKESVYKDFVGRYQVQKTLRFKLKPVGETENKINDRKIIVEDRRRAEDAKRVKEIIDDMHREFIDDVLSDPKIDAKIDGWKKLAKTIDEAEKKKKAAKRKDKEEDSGKGVDVSEDEDASQNESKGENKKNSVTEQQKKQRMKIVKLFTSDKKRYNLIANGNTGFIKENLVVWMKKKGKYKSDDFKKVESFAKFTGYFDKYAEARENMYSDEPKGTAIANRIVNENFNRFLTNVKVVNNLKDFESKKYQLPSEYGACFDVLNYNTYLSQTGIESYNEQIGKINKLLNEKHLRKRIAKKVKLLTLYKQILSDVDPLFQVEKLNSDGELAKEILNFFESWKTKDVEEDEIKNPLVLSIDFLKNITDYEDGEILVHPKNLGVLAKCMPEGIGRNKIIEALDIGENSKKEITLTEIVNKLNSAFDDKEIEFDEVVAKAVEALEKVNKEVFELDDKGYILGLKVAIKEIFKKYENSDEKSLLDNVEDKKIIKDFLDEIKDKAEPFRNLFGKRNDNTPSLFQQNYNDCNYAYKEFDKRYNLIRNYLTQKPDCSEKFKLYFGNPGLNIGDKNKERAYKTFILKNNINNYFLAIIPRDSEFKSNKLTGSSLAPSNYQKIEKGYIKISTLLQNLMIIDGRTVRKTKDLDKHKKKHLPLNIRKIKQKRSYLKSEPSFNQEDSIAFISYYMERLIEYRGDKFDFTFKDPS